MLGGGCSWKRLNKIQQKTVFQILMSEQLSLIRGIPDSGKTTTL
jgi:hypothetical protein